MLNEKNTKIIFSFFIVLVIASVFFKCTTEEPIQRGGLKDKFRETAQVEVEQSTSNVVIEHNKNWYWAAASRILDQCKKREPGIDSDCKTFLDEKCFDTGIKKEIPSNFKVTVSRQKECKGWYLNVDKIK